MITENILDFIKRRFEGLDANWLNGNCYYFALILSHRFPQLEIYYDPITGHFVAGDGNIYFDWTGIYKPEKSILFSLENIKQSDELFYNRLIRDCVM